MPTHRWMDKKMLYLTMGYYSGMKRNEILIPATTQMNLKNKLSEGS